MRPVTSPSRRRLTRAATAVAIITSPAVVYVWLTERSGWSWWVALLATAGIVIATRGVVDLAFHRFIPWPSLFGLES